LPGVVETVPSMRALMVCYDPLATTRAVLQPEIEALVTGGLEAAAPSRTLAIPCCYDDPEFAPDLPDVARRTGLTPEQVIARHTASDFHVYVLGFMPGLAYVVGLAPELELPRRSQPRVRVPRSSVGIAMNMTTIYPFDSPGGWHLLGRTPLWMFDQRREQPVLLAPGDRLQFRRIGRPEYDATAAQVEAGTLDWSTLEVKA
jgi:KipI family sensor histidine kinase inhibitor